MSYIKKWSIPITTHIGPLRNADGQMLNCPGSRDGQMSTSRTKNYSTAIPEINTNSTVQRNLHLALCLNYDEIFLFLCTSMYEKSNYFSAIAQLCTVTINWAGNPRDWVKTESDVIWSTQTHCSWSLSNKKEAETGLQSIIVDIL